MLSANCINKSSKEFQLSMCVFKIPILNALEFGIAFMGKGPTVM